MKKIFFIAILSIVFITAKAQFGIKSGLNFSTWHGDDISGDDVTSVWGFYGGIYYNAKVNEQFSIQPELVYSAEGTKEQGGDEKIKVNYINVTPLGRFNTRGGFFLGTGPQFGFTVSAKDKVGGNSEDIKDDLNGFNFSWAFAGGFDFKSGFGVSVRFNLGLTDIIEDNLINAKSGCFQFGLHYRLLPTKK